LRGGIRCSSLPNGHDGVVGRLDSQQHTGSGGHSAAQAHQHWPTTPSAQNHVGHRVRPISNRSRSGRGSAARLCPKAMKDKGSVAKITPAHGHIGAALRGVELALVSLSVPSGAVRHCSRPAVFLKRERLEGSMSQMAPFAAWPIGLENSDSPNHERLEGRCRTTGARSRLAPCATGKAGCLALTGFRLARPFGFHALMASCERGAPLVYMAGLHSDGDRKGSQRFGVDATNPSQTLRLNYRRPHS
jgi:hypothetical protein